LGTIANGANATITLVTRVDAGVPAGTAIANTATVTSAVSDPTPANNTSSTSASPTLVIPTLSPFGFGVLGLALAACAATFLRSTVFAKS
jgi:hypothetical protein